MRSIIGDLVYRVIGDTSGFDSAMGKSEQKVKGFAGVVKAAEANAVGMAAALAVVAKQAFDAGKAFDQGLGNVATLLNDPNKNLEQLKDNVKDLAIDTGLSLQDLSDGLYQTVSAFGDTAEATEQLGLAARAAKAGVATVTDSINLASAVTKAYGDTSAEAQSKVFDLAFQTVKLGQTTFPELASSIQNVTDRSQALGVSQEELFATMATLTGVTGNASVVSTQLKSALVALDSPTETLTDLYTRLGVESGRALIEQEGLQGAFQIIIQDSEEAGVSLNDYFGRVEAVTAASALATSQSETYAEKLEEVTNSTGAANRAFEVQTEALNGTAYEYDRLNQSLEVYKTTLYDFWSEDLANTFSGLTKIIEGLGNLNDAFQRGQEKFGPLSDILNFANPITAVGEYNSQIFRLIGNIGEATEEAEEYTDSWLLSANAQARYEPQITDQLTAQAEAQQKQSDEMQRLIDLEAQRVNTVIESRGEIESAYLAEVKAIETKNELGILQEQEYINAKLAAEEKYIEDLINLGYDGQARQGEQLEIGDQMILESLERQKELNESFANDDLEIKKDGLDKFAEEHEKTMAKAISQQNKLGEQTIKNRQLFADLATIGIGSVSSGFAQLGADLVNQELSWKSFAKLALDAVSAVLEGIGARLAGDAALLVAEAILFGNPALAAGAGPALIASGAAYGTAGALRATAGSFQSGGVVPGIPSPTDNKVAMVRSGEEIIPEEDPRHSYNQESSQLTINMVVDLDVISKLVVEDYINTGIHTITARGIRQ